MQTYRRRLPFWETAYMQGREKTIIVCHKSWTGGLTMYIVGAWPSFYESQWPEQWIMSVADVNYPADQSRSSHGVSKPSLALICWPPRLIPLTFTSCKLKLICAGVRCQPESPPPPPGCLQNVRSGLPIADSHDTDGKVWKCIVWWSNIPRCGSETSQWSKPISIFGTNNYINSQGCILGTMVGFEGTH